jgi:hypothetical protein
VIEGVLAASHGFCAFDEGLEAVGSASGEVVEDGVGHELVVVFLDGRRGTE